MSFPQHPGDFFVYGDGRTVRHGITQYNKSLMEYYRANVAIYQSIADAFTAPYRLEMERLRCRTQAFCRALEMFTAAGEQATRQVQALAAAVASPALMHDERMAMILLMDRISQRGALPDSSGLAGFLRG